MKISQSLRPVLGAEFIEIGPHGTVSLRGKGGIIANVARILEDGTVRHHSDMYGKERPVEWRAALERAIFIPCSWCGQWHLFYDVKCPACAQPVEL